LEIQLQHASSEEQHLLKAASVAGLQFTVWAVSRMLAGDSLHLESVCDALADRQQFLKYTATRDLPNGEQTAEYRFTHALYREILYRRLSPTQRTMFHKRLASGLEELRSPVEPETAGQIALHFEEGLDFSRALQYLLVAAENAARRYAHQQAVAILEHARSLLPRVPEDERPRLELQILERIGNAHYALGEMGQSAATYELMAVRAADHGLLSVQGDALMRLAHPAESAPYFLKAIELDPDFVAAYTSLSRIYSNIGEGEPAKEYARRAYERRDRVDERERLSITYQYHFEVTGDQARAGETLEAWKQAFPLDFQPVSSLAVMHNFLGNFDLAIAEGLKAVRRNPAHGYPYSNLAHAYRGVGRFGDAKHTAERAVSRQIETLPTRRLLYELALVEGDLEGAAKHFEWARGRPREFEMVSARAQAAAWMGKVRDARELFEEAGRLAEMRQLPDAASGRLARIMSVELAYGNGHEAGKLARRVLASKSSYDPRLRAAAVLAATGSAGEAEAIVAELVSASPNHTLINSVLAPIVRATIELSRNCPARALEELQAVAPYELGFIAALAPLDLRARSLLALGAGLPAAAEFQRILDHRGSDLFSPFHAVAHVGFARAHALAGDVVTSRKAYEQFFDDWAQADADIPILRAARSEYRRLGRTGRTS
jgi:eukaryotic-like serine/threonine-protein kinase